MRQVITFVATFALFGTFVGESVAQHWGGSSRCAPRVYHSPHVHPWTPAHQLPPAYYARSGRCAPRYYAPAYDSCCIPYRPPKTTLQDRLNAAERIREAQKTTPTAAPPEERPTPPSVPFPIPAPPEPEPPEEEPKIEKETAKVDIRTALEARGNFGELIKAAHEAGVVVELDQPGPFVVFAPTDEAFAKLPPGRLERLKAKPESLRQLLFYHALSEPLTLADAIRQGQVATLLGPPVRFTQQGDETRVNEAKVIGTAIECTNGTIHVIDRLLQPVLEPPQTPPPISE